MGDKKGWQLFKQKCLELDNLDDLEAFFALFLTHTEREEIARRYLIVLELLQAEKTQREIARELGVSIANVTRGSNVLKETKTNIKRIIYDNK